MYLLFFVTTLITVSGSWDNFTLGEIYKMSTLITVATFFKLILALFNVKNSTLFQTYYVIIFLVFLSIIRQGNISFP
jgi:hypothetical protein